MGWLKREFFITLFVGIDAGLAWLISWMTTADYVPMFLIMVAFTAHRALWDSKP